jgi:hypothetical protein
MVAVATIIEDSRDPLLSDDLRPHVERRVRVLPSVVRQGRPERVVHGITPVDAVFVSVRESVRPWRGAAETSAVQTGDREAPT